MGSRQPRYRTPGLALGAAGIVSLSGAVIAALLGEWAAALGVATAGSALLAAGWALLLPARAMAGTPGVAPSGVGAGGPAARSLQAELERTRDDAEATAQRHEVLIQAISHDLRSPLGAILNYAAILEEDYGDALDDDAAHMLSRIRSSAERAMERIEGLLQLSRLGRAEIDWSDLDMTALAREAAADNVDPSVRWEIGELPAARGDRVLIRRVLGELFRNASRHCTGTDDATITVAGRAEGDRATFQVSDNGGGYDMRFQAKLFRPFERLRDAGDEGGVGLGLAIVETIVQRHGGSVTARGKVDEGATFGFSLPGRERP